MDRQELKDLLDSLIDQVKTENESYKAMFGSADFTAEQRKAKYEDILKLTNQVNEVKAQIKEFDDAAASKMKGDPTMENAKKNEIIAMNAEIVRAALDNRVADLSKFSNEAVEGNFTIDGGNHMTRGDKLLPANMSNDLLYEPMAKNQFRELSKFTSIMNLELPKISFDVASGAGTVGGVNNAGAGVPAFLDTDSETA